jgi:hypothetical protein
MGMYGFEMPWYKNMKEFLQVPCDMYFPLLNVWHMFPTSAVIHDLDSHLFHKSMETHGFSHAKFHLAFWASWITQVTK